MDQPVFTIRQCVDDDCRFRFPAPAALQPEPTCPRCHGVTLIAGPSFPGRSAATTCPPAGPPLEALLDNIRSIYNVGAMIRTADGAGVRHLHLGGITATPEHPRLAKTALGAERAVPWTAHNNCLEAAHTLRERGYRLWALEGGSRAESLFALGGLRPAIPLVLVVGNELAGVDPALLALCHRVLSIPMQGVKASLNAAVAFGVAVYYLRYGLPVLTGE